MTKLDENFWATGAIVSLNASRVLLAYGSSVSCPHEKNLDPDKPIFYLPGFFLNDSSPWIQYDSWSEMSIVDLLDALQLEDAPKPLTWEMGHESQFQSAFADLQQAFNSDSLSKAVPYTFAYSKGEMDPIRLRKSLKQALLSIQKFPGYIYGRWNPENGFLGVTPEVLLKSSSENPSKIQTMALAGTFPQSQKIIDSKLLHEHQIVVDDITQQLNKIGSVTISTMERLLLSRFAHLMTPIHAQLTQPVSLPALIRLLHPTPALGAFPRPAGWKWLENYQTIIDRNYYGAPFTLLYQKSILSLVAIRQVQWSPDGLRIGAGAGVVKESQSRLEWEEIKLKIVAIKELLAL